jgi:hypothetical protein
MREWYRNNREKKKRASREWRKNNLERAEENARKWKANNPDRTRAHGRKSYRKHRVATLERRQQGDPKGYLIRSARYRAAAKKIPFALTPEHIHIPSVCPALGMPLEFGRGAAHDNSPTLDRFDPSLGYVPGNVHVISHLANRIKNSSTVEQIEAVAHWMRAVAQENT